MHYSPTCDLCAAASREELDAVTAHMGSLSHGDDEEHCCASRAPARPCQVSLQKGAPSDATAAGTAGASTFHSLPVLEDDDDGKASSSTCCAHSTQQVKLPLPWAAPVTQFCMDMHPDES